MNKRIASGVTRALCAVSLCGSCGVVTAQTMYRCGNTFSQTPCGTSAVGIKADGVPQPIPTAALDPLTPARHEAVRLMCERGIREKPAWKDRKSIEIRAFRRAARSEVVKLHQKRQLIVPWYAIVNAKNSFGAFAGEQIVDCYFDPSETRLLEVYVNRG